MNVRKRINPERITNALRAYMANSKRKLSAVLIVQCKGIGKNLIAVTPPSSLSGGRRQGVAAKKWGEDRVSKQIRSLFQTVSPRSVAKLQKAGETVVSDPASVHKAHRDRDGNVKKVAKKFLIPSNVLTSYVNQIKKRVGYLASGWRGLQKLGVPIPAWIARNSGKARPPVLETKGTLLRMTFKNDVRYAGDHKLLTSRLQWAVDSQAKQIEKQVGDFMSKKEKV